MKNPETKTKIVHSKNNAAWNIIAVSLGKKHKIAVLPYIKGSEFAKQEALQHAEFISYCFNESDFICLLSKD